MYDVRKWHKSLKKGLDEETALKGKTISLLQVELGLYLLERLNLRDEPVLVLWVLLNGLPIPNHRLRQLDNEQKRLLANGRMLLPFTRSIWLGAGVERLCRHSPKVPCLPNQISRFR